MRIVTISMTQCVVTSDSRVFREAVSLKEAGHEVMVIGVMRTRRHLIPSIDEYKGIQIRRIVLADGSINIILRLVRIIYILFLLRFLVRIIPMSVRRKLDSILFPTKYMAMITRLEKAYKILRGFRPDAVHAHDLVTMPLAYLCKLRWGSRIVYDNHELWLDRNVPQDMRWLWRRIEFAQEWFLAHKADAIITVGDAISKIMGKRYKLPVTTLHNYPIPKGDTLSLRKRLLIPESQKVILYLGLITPNRGVEESIKMLEHLQGYCLVMMGYFLEDWYQIQIEKMIDQEKMSDRVYFMPAVPFDQVTSWASSADVGVMFQAAKWKSYELSFPNKLLESVAAGLPVVVNKDCVEMAEFVKKHDIGTYVHVGEDNMAEIAEQIELAVSTPRYAVNSAKLAKSIDWNEEVKKLLDIYRSFDAQTS